MTLSDLASVGSFVSALAVLISLIYLALQVRQAERNQRALMQQGRADRVSGNCLKMAEPGPSHVYGKGSSGDEGLTAEQFAQFMMMCRAGFLSGEDSFLQHLSGQLGDAPYRSYVAGARSLFAQPGLRAAWRLSSQQYGNEYRKFMDGILNETRVGQADNPLAR